MKIKPTIGSVVAATDEHHWGQILILPNAYGAVEVYDRDGAARDIGLRLLSNLSERLTESPVSLTEVEACAKDVTHPCLTSLIVFVPVGLVAYFVLVGSGAVYLKRGDRLAKLLDGPGSLSGELAVDDTILMATKRFVETIGETDLARAFDHLDTATIAEKLTTRLSKEDGAVGSAGLVFGVGKIIPIEEEPLVAERLPAVTYAWHRTRDRFSGKNGALLAIATVSIILFVGSVLLGVKKQLAQGTDRRVAGSLVEAQHAFDEGVALLDLNPVKGRERLQQAKIILDPLAATVSAKTKAGRQIATLTKEVNDRLTLAMQVYRGEPQLFYDVSLLKKGATISSLALSDDIFVLLDRVGRTVFTLDPETKSGAIIAGGEFLGDGKFVAKHGDSVYVYANEGVHRIRLSDQKVEAFIMKSSPEWGTVASLLSYGGNLYLLSPPKGRIWKYVATGSGFSEIREYLNPDTLPDFTSATDMAIDGSVWVGTSKGIIMRFTQGRENTFLPKGVEPVFGNDLVVYTSDDTLRVYVLDRGNKRVVMLDKDGTYVSQYVWEGNVIPSQFVVSERLKKILLLADGKIYALEMK